MSVCPSGVESGFVTLPRLSRSERQQSSVSTPAPTNIHRGSLTDPSDGLLFSGSTSMVTPKPKHTSGTAYSDSLPSLGSLDAFTFDLGPSLLSEVFSLIDGHSDECLPKSENEEEEEFRPTSEGSETGSATLSYVDSLLREDCRSGTSPPADDFEEAETVAKLNRVEFSGKVPDVLMGSRVGIRMESERFQSATDVLTCPYDVSFSKRHNGMECGEPELVIMSQPKNKTSYSFMEDEDEIKV